VTGILKAADENHPVEDRVPDRTIMFIYRDISAGFSSYQKTFIDFRRKRGTRGSRFEGFQLFFNEAINSSMGIAGMLKILMVPLAPSSIETLAIVSLFGASTIFTKS
jgi:hypothetical protein